MKQVVLRIGVSNTVARKLDGIVSKSSEPSARKVRGRKKTGRRRRLSPAASIETPKPRLAPKRRKTGRGNPNWARLKRARNGRFVKTTRRAKKRR